MKEHFENEQFSRYLNKQLEKEADQIEEELAKHPELTGVAPDDSVKMKLDEQIEEYERQKAVSRLSRKDREALELGRMLQAEREAGQESRDGQSEKSAGERVGEEKVRRAGWIRRGGWKRIAVLAAAMVFVLGIGITSVGGPERVVEVMQQMVGDREVTKINADNDEVLSSEGLVEEEAYQEIKDKLGIDPVRITKEEGMRFIDAEIDEILQTANLLFGMDDNIVSYIISVSYADESFGADIEDQLIDIYPYTVNDISIEVKEYLIAEGGETEFSAEFDYQKVHYQLTGIMGKNQMENLLKNLYIL